MGKCVKCGKQTENQYKISAVMNMGSEFSNSYNYRHQPTIVTTTKYLVLEEVNGYACSKCLVKKHLTSVVIWTALLVVLIAATVALIPRAFAGVQNILARNNIDKDTFLFFCVACLLIWAVVFSACAKFSVYKIYQVLFDKRISSADGLWGGELIAEYYSDTLKARHPGCTILTHKGKM